MSMGLPGVISPVLDGLQRAEHELLLFACFWFIIGAIDELAIDCTWIWLKLTGRGAEPRLPRGSEARPLTGRVAVLVPTWHEAAVISQTVSHMLRAWPQHGLTVYVGCYLNDSATAAAAIKGAKGDPRFRLVVNNRGIM